MTFDILSTIGLTAGAAILVAALIVLFGQNSIERALIGGALALWFVAILWIGATGLLRPEGGLGTPGLGIVVTVPSFALILIGLISPRARRLILEAPATLLIAPHAMRVLGIVFVILYAEHRLPAPFAPAAGWGDVAIGLTALPMAYLVSRGERAAALPLLIWNALGLADLFDALALGAMSAPGPLQLFHGSPSSEIMTSLPWILIPCFIVPLLIFLHVASIYRLTQLPAAKRLLAA
jgi:hypothetical protein